MHDSDEARIGALMTRFLRAVSFRQATNPSEYWRGAAEPANGSAPALDCK